MTTQHDEPNTEKLLTAALALQAHQLDYIRKAQVIAAAELKMKGLSAILEEAEFELAEADALYANTRLNVLRLIREKRRLAILKHTEVPRPDKARTELWRLCATGSAEEIIEAASKYSEVTTSFSETARAELKAGMELSEAHEALAAASAARKLAVQKRGKAKADVLAANTELNAARNACPLESVKFFDLEKAVTVAALAMHATQDREYSYGFVYTPELGITGPGLELPVTGDSDVETQVRWLEAHAYGRKPTPARED